MEEKIELKDFFFIIKRKFYITIILAILGMGISGWISFYLLNPIYEAKTTLIVNTTKPSGTTIITGDQLNVTEKLAGTYAEIIKSESVLDEVARELNTDISSANVSISVVRETQIISVFVQDVDREKATKIANTIPTALNKELKRITEESNVSVIDIARLPELPVKPNKVIIIGLSTIFSIILSIFIILILEYKDNRIKSEKDVEKYLDLPVIGKISNESNYKKGSR